MISILCMGLLDTIIKKAGTDRNLNLLEKMGFFLDNEKTALDCGCGTGLLSKRIAEKYSLEITGIEVNPRHLKEKNIHVEPFDGEKIPFEDNSFDCVFFIDVLHHAGKPFELLEEALRVSRRKVIVKDHFYRNRLDWQILKIADDLGNKGTGNVLPYNFISDKGWNSFFEGKTVRKISWRSAGLVPEIMAEITLNE